MKITCYNINKLMMTIFYFNISKDLEVLEDINNVMLIVFIALKN